uniref:Uncharacterized protein n=1 Tax=Amphimedon queenslandica TaxID=400682 RepID=A0A1X7TZE0_AMPQE
MDLHIDCWSRLHQLILRYTPTTGLTGLDEDDDEDEKRTSDLMMMMKMKKGG